MVEEIKLKQRIKLPAENDHSIPSTAPKSNTELKQGLEEPKKKFIEYFYDKEHKKFFGRTCKSWGLIILYGFIYLTFLSTFTLILLYLSLFLIKSTVDFKQLQPMHLTYPEAAIGLTATPTSEYGYPLIWYKHGEENDYKKYVQAIDRLLVNNRNKSDINNLGPCSESPYGYGETPCIIIRINKHFHWSGKPLQLNSSVTELVPPEVKTWMKMYSNKLWLQCNGYHSYDKEHIGSIKYYPHPPGFDSNLFPLNKYEKSPLIAIQIANFTKGISLAIECKLWFEKGPASVEFVLYVAPTDGIMFHSSM